LANLVNAFKSDGPLKNTTATVKHEGALSLSMTDCHEEMRFFNYASWKVIFTPKVGVLIALNSKPQFFSKLVDWVISYVAGKCTIQSL
jgi:hypothetical protein